MTNVNNSALHNSTIKSRIVEKTVSINSQNVVQICCKIIIDFDKRHLIANHDVHSDRDSKYILDLTDKMLEMSATIHNNKVL